MDAFSLCIDRSTAIGGKPPPTFGMHFPVGGGLAPDGHATVLHMQRMPQRPQRRFLDRLTQGRVGVDGAGYVFQA